jgi:mRNA-degrading endonuclease YafQ of YafQ-DinJ toxin-antitoxin module
VPKILYTHSYIRRAAKFVKKHPEMVAQYEKTLTLLEANPTHPSLRLHGLSGKLEGLCSVSINMSYRISLEFMIQEDTIIPVDIGTHDEVY